jgi:hypothetical protein
MAWSNTFNKRTSYTGLTEEEENEILLEAKKRFKQCEDWEAQARRFFDYDYKFAKDRKSVV